jgi:hypothetical protein
MNSKTAVPAKKKVGKEQALTPAPVQVETVAQKRSRIEDEMRSKPRIKLDIV